MSGCFVGVDTSNYTTSIGIVDTAGNIIANIKKLLPVSSGECGLRQSDAVFAHIKNLPEVLEEAHKVLLSREILAIGFSSRPRNVDGSYMPCFLCGVNTAMALGAGKDIPKFAFSHQCGHISAALTSADKWDISASPFIAFHVSGGTTEVLLCKSDSDGFTAELVGGTLDLNAGQAIDRAGVMMGMQFPCGAELERTANEYAGKICKPKISVSDGYCNLSGLENLSAKLFKESGDKAKTSAYVLEFVAQTFFRIAKDARTKHGDLPIVFAGGVMSNMRIRNLLMTLGDVYFAEPTLSTDNAVGIAMLTKRKFEK